MSPKAWLTVAFFISSAMTVSFYLIPFFSPSGSLVNLDGTPGVMDHWDIWSGKDPFTMILYSIGDMVCHQQMSRTLILNGSEMPICIRDLGLLMGFMIGCLITSVRFGHPMIYNSARPYVIVSFLLIFTDWLIQHIFDLNIPVTRFITGLLAGAGFSMILYCWVFSIYYGNPGSRNE